MQHLLLIHIGPVQDFIASARRSRDLWFGSWLLSELSKAAAQAIVEQEGGNIDSLIFPAPTDKVLLQANTDFNVANKIIAVIQNLPDQSGAMIEQALQKRLKEIQGEAFKEISGSFKREVAEAQVKDLLEYFWVALPLKDPAEYILVREQAEVLIAARKSTRNFTPVSWGENLPKSSLDGIREAVIPESEYPAPGDNQEIRQQKTKAIYTRYGARSAERLSGVDLLKRHGRQGQETRFPSTSHIASLPLIAGLSKADNIKSLWDKYLQQLPEEVIRQERIPQRFEQPVFGRSDGSLLFESRLAESLEGFEDKVLRKAKTELRSFLRDAASGQQPLPYYALLLADGDHMGRVINAQPDTKGHRVLSRTLNTFAIGVKNIVENDYKGVLIYAGGDDVLAFLPLHTVLNCARTLANTFEEQMKAFQDGDGNSPTFSVGIAVNHHLEPLSDALDLARQVEQAAKTVKGKNALAVAVNMRGGVTRTIVGKRAELDDRLRKFIGFHRQDAIPDGAAYQLRDAALRLGGEEIIRHNTTLQEVMRKEGMRILSRKKAEHGTQKLTKIVLQEIEKSVMDPQQPIENLAQELIITRLFANASNQANEVFE